MCINTNALCTLTLFDVKKKYKKKSFFLIGLNTIFLYLLEKEKGKKGTNLFHFVYD